MCGVPAHTHKFSIGASWLAELKNCVEQLRLNRNVGLSCVQSVVPENAVSDFIINEVFA